MADGGDAIPGTCLVAWGHWSQLDMGTLGLLGSRWTTLVMFPEVHEKLF